MSSHRSRREVRVPERFSPRAKEHDPTPAAGAEPRKRARSPSLSGGGEAVDKLLVQNERHHTELRAELGTLREELTRQTRQLARCIRGLVDVQDVLLDIHESTAKNAEDASKRKWKATRQEESAAEHEAPPKPAPIVEEVVSLQASAEQIPTPDSPFPSGYPTACEPPPAIMARMETIAK